MNRAERRRQKKAELKREVTWTITRSQLDEILSERTDEAIDHCFTILMAVCLEVLHDVYGFGCRNQSGRLADFTDAVLARYKEIDTSTCDWETYREYIVDKVGIGLVFDKNAKIYD